MIAEQIQVADVYWIIDDLPIIIQRKTPLIERDTP